MAHLSLVGTGMATARLVCCFILVLLGRVGVAEAPNAGRSSVPVNSLVRSDVSEHASETAVRIEHELVHAQVTAEKVRARYTRPARRFHPNPPNDDMKVTSRVRRVLFGDGTYRPQPFPRPTPD